MPGGRARRRPGQGALAVAAGHHAVRHPGQRAQGLDLEDVAGRRAGDEHRAGDDVGAVDVERAGRPVVVPGDLHRVVEDLAAGDAAVGEPGHGVAALVLEDALVRHRVDGDRRPGRHGEGGVGVQRGDVAPPDLVRRRRQVVLAVDPAAARLEDPRGPSTRGVRGRPSRRGRRVRPRRRRPRARTPAAARRNPRRPSPATSCSRTCGWRRRGRHVWSCCRPGLLGSAAGGPAAAGDVYAPVRLQCTSLLRRG